MLEKDPSNRFDINTVAAYLLSIENVYQNSKQCEPELTINIHSKPKHAYFKISLTLKFYKKLIIISTMTLIFVSCPQ